MSEALVIPCEPCPWVCPHCGNPLAGEGRQLRCSSGHSYDVASQGYVNLLLANQKNSKIPGDSTAMVAARRSFFSRGHYRELFHAVAKYIVSVHASLPQEYSILDIGCGEGSYLHHAMHKLFVNDSDELKVENRRIIVCGIDISKSAVKCAAAQVKRANFAVASSYAIPMPDASVDLALNVFAPLKSSELLRVLKPTGHILRVSPGKKHLHQIKETIYTQAKEHDEPTPLENFSCVNKQLLSFRRELSAEDLALLLAMTPLSWRGNKEAKDKLLTTASLVVDFDFVIELLAPQVELR